MTTELGVVLVAVLGALFLGMRLAGPGRLGIAFVAAGAMLVACGM